MIFLAHLPNRVQSIFHDLKFEENEAIQNIIEDNTKVIESTKVISSWLEDNLNAKSRRYRWTVVQACIVGWAEAIATQSSKSCAFFALKDILYLDTKIHVKQSTKDKSRRHLQSEGEYQEILKFLIQVHFNYSYVQFIFTCSRKMLLLIALTQLVEHL